MLLVDEIAQYYPQKLRPFKRFILREYVQCKILDIIYASEAGIYLSFIGGTALRLLYNNQRFSEDLDFDNLGLDTQSLIKLTHLIQEQLTREGFTVTIKNTAHHAFRCRIRMPELLYQNKLSPLKSEQIMIQFDTEPQYFEHQPVEKFLNQFDVMQTIHSSSLDILYSQKLFTAFNRQRLKGRDFFDILFLANKTAPNYKYLNLKLGIDNQRQLYEYLVTQSKTLDFEALAQDVKPFLINASDVKKVQLFPDWLDSWQ